MEGKVMIMLDASELEALIERGVTKALAKSRKEPVRKEFEHPITIKEAAKLISLAEGTIYNKCSNNEIPHYSLNSKLYFFESELISWIRTGKIMTNEEVREAADKYLNKRDFRRR